MSVRHASWCGSSGWSWRTPDGRWLAPAAAARLLRCYGLDVIDLRRSRRRRSRRRSRRRIGLPAVLKATGAVVHKSDVGGVRVGLTTRQEVRQAYRDMIESWGPP